MTNTITARLDNVTNEVYRNHLNYLKDVLPEMGRNFKGLRGGVLMEAHAGIDLGQRDVQGIAQFARTV